MKQSVSVSDWEQVANVACEVANAMMRHNPSLYASKHKHLMSLLDSLESKYGERAMITATRGEFPVDPFEAKKCLERALELARVEGDSEVEIEILDSLRHLDL